MGHIWTRLNISPKKPLDCFDGTVFALSLKKKNPVKRMNYIM